MSKFRVNNIVRKSTRLSSARFAIRFLFNPDAENPTAGLRGLLVLAIGLTSPAWLDWQTSGLPLAVVFIGGVLVGLQLLSEAQRQNTQLD